MYPSEVATASLDVSVVLPCYNERDHVELEIKRTCCPATRGAGTARRIGTQQATGRVVVWSDADMTYPNDRIPEFVSQVAEVRDVTSPFPWTTISATLRPR
jgi:polyisoprenyl-phosphate glycosyltransferase